MNPSAKDSRAIAAAKFRDHFAQFGRNGRWGTCVGCPRDATGAAYPEFCEYTERYDHQLTISHLAQSFEREVDAVFQAKRWDSGEVQRG